MVGLRHRPDFWGFYVNDGPRKEGEKQFAYAWRMKRARVNMAMERRMFPNPRNKTPPGPAVWNAEK
jgi:hypothetical protein